MKIYITADIEGVCGITNWDETQLGEAEYTYFRNQMTNEVNSACIGANLAGAKEIFVRDAHDSATNIIPSSLPKNVKIMRSWSKNPLVMMDGIDKSFDAVVVIGYHSGSYQNGNPLSHSMDREFDYIKINGEIATEFMINSYIAGLFDVPVVFLSGDEMLCENAKKLVNNISTVAVNKGIGNATISIHPQLAVELIQERVEKVLKEDLNNYKINMPNSFDIEIKFKEHYKAYKASFYPNVEQIDSKTIHFKTDDYYEFLRMLLFI